MHIRKSETTPRGLLFLFASMELFSAFASIGLSALAERGNILSIPLGYFLVFLDRSLIGGWTMVALWRANRAGIWRGLKIIGMFILEFSVKDLIGNTAAGLMENTYSFGGCLLKGLAMTLIHTTLLEGAVVLALFWFSWYLFLSRRGPADPYPGLFRIRGNTLSEAELLLISLLTVRFLIERVIATVEYGNKYDCLLRSSQIQLMVAAFVVLFAAGFVSYLVAGTVRRFFLAETPADSKPAVQG